MLRPFGPRILVRKLEDTGSPIITPDGFVKPMWFVVIDPGEIDGVAAGDKVLVAPTMANTVEVFPGDRDRYKGLSWVHRDHIYCVEPQGKLN